MKNKNTKKVGSGIVLNKEQDTLSDDFISSGNKEQDMNLEKRMYFLVPYNISPIQQAIQAGHAALEYAHLCNDDPEYIDFIENWKTWIILNGGTTNSTLDSELNPLGTLDQIVQEISDHNNLHDSNRIKFTLFHEPDLNNALTAICLVVDERVFNREDYPDFKEWVKIKEFDLSSLSDENYDELYDFYRVCLGEKIVFLKELLNTKKLA